jgi:cell division protein FtsQ
VGYSGYRLARFVLSSPDFRLASADDVVVSGNRYASREEILGALGLAAVGSSGFWALPLSLDDKRRKVESIPWVRAAVLSRTYPHRLEVRVVERTPVALVMAGGRLKLVDGDGTLLERPEKGNFDFPLLTGVDSEVSAIERQSRVTIYREFTRQVADIAPKSGWMVSEVDVTDPDDLKALLVEKQETIRAHFGNGSFGERFQDFLTLLPEVRKMNTRIDSVDLRYRNQIVVNPGTGDREQGIGNRE